MENLPMPHSNLDLLGDITPKNIQKRPANSDFVPGAASHAPIKPDGVSDHDQESFKHQFNQIRQATEADIAEKGKILPKDKASTSNRNPVIERKPVEKVVNAQISTATETIEESSAIEGNKPSVSLKVEDSVEPSLDNLQFNILIPQTAPNQLFNNILPSNQSFQVVDSPDVVLNAEQTAVTEANIEEMTNIEVSNLENAKTSTYLATDAIHQSLKLEQLQKHSTAKAAQNLKLAPAISEEFKLVNTGSNNQLQDSILASTNVGQVKSDLTFSNLNTEFNKTPGKSSNGDLEKKNLSTIKLATDATIRTEHKPSLQQYTNTSVASDSKLNQDLLGSIKSDTKVSNEVLNEKELQAQIFSKSNKNPNQSDKIANLLHQSSDIAPKAKLSTAVTPPTQGLSLEQLTSLSLATNPLNKGLQSLAMTESTDGLAATTLPSTAINNANNITAVQNGSIMGRDFSPNLAMRVQWMFQQAVNSAEIMLDPPELGPLTVKLHNQNGETSVIFHVNNGQAKDLIETNLAKLKELLAEQGISLGDAHVEQQKQQEKQSSYGKGQRPEHAASIDSLETKAKVVQQGLLDAYI